MFPNRILIGWLVLVPSKCVRRDECLCFSADHKNKKCANRLIDGVKHPARIISSLQFYTDLNEHVVLYTEEKSTGVSLLTSMKGFCKTFFFF